MTGTYGFFSQGVSGVRESYVSAKEQDIFWRGLYCYPEIVSKSDFYLSQYLFPPEWVEYCKSNGGSTRGYAGAVRVKYLSFDIDRADDLQAALDDTRRLVDYCVQSPADGAELGRVVPDTDSLMIFFSGKKGFHVLIPVVVFGSAFSDFSDDYAERLKSLALYIALCAGVEIDSSVYDRQRLFRCPNTRHGSTGLYKIPLSFFELTCLSIEQIQARAERPRAVYVAGISPVKLPDSVEFHPVKSAVESAVKLCADCFKSVDTPAESTPKGQRQSGRYLCNIQTMPGSGEVYPRIKKATCKYIRYGAQEGERERSLFAAAADFASCGVPKEVVFAFLPDVARDTGLNIYEIERAINCGYEQYYRSCDNE